MLSRKPFFIILTSLITLIGSASYAGPSSSGGGNELISSFISISQNVLSKAKFSAAHKTALSDALRSTRIITTKVLKDADGRTVPDQEQMLAYTYPGLIQLKVRGPSGDSWEEAVKTNRPVAHIVIHELFRATGAVENGRSIDDTFQLSVLTYKLNQIDNAGIKLSSPVELHYWKCQCFSDLDSGSPDGGLNLIGESSLFAAENKAQPTCNEVTASTRAVARCHKYVGDPNKL